MKTLRKVIVLVAAAFLLAACGSTGTLERAANQPLPPLESSVGAATHEWQPTINFQLQVHSGFSTEGALLPDGPPTYQETAYVAQISGRCAANIQDAVRGVTWLKLKRTLRSGAALGGGAVIGAMLGIESPTSAVLRQVGSMNGMAGGLANLDAVDFQLSIILSSAHAQCVLNRVEHEPQLRRVIIVMVPLLEFAPTPPQAPRLSRN